MSNEAWSEYWGDWVWPAEAETADGLARKVLGVSSDAGPKEFKAAYRSLARQFHPDTNPSDEGLAEEFKVISEAYEILTTDRNLRSRRLTSLRSGQTEPAEPKAYAEWWLESFPDAF